MPSQPARRLQMSLRMSFLSVFGVSTAATLAAARVLLVGTIADVMNVYVVERHDDPAAIL